VRREQHFFDASPRAERSLQAVFAVLAIAVVVFFVGWPGVHGFWGRDDYFQLALARMIGSPWPLFAHDHFPVPGSVFRPLGFASMWLDTRLFGTAYAPHAICDLALHATVALALFGVLRRAGATSIVAMLAALMFALHPAASGTAQWWSARFDVLATLFVLLALRGALAYRARPSALVLCAALLAAFAAMASKEIGLAAPAAMILVWLRWAWREPHERGRALRACAYALACAALFLAWRAAVLGTATSGILGSGSLVTALGSGLHAWLRDAGGYFSYAALLSTAQRVLIGCAAFAMVFAIVVARVVRRRRVFSSAPASRRDVLRGDLVVCGLCLLLLPALLQAPVAMLNAASLRGEFSAIEAAMQSRLYYLGIAGAALLLGAMLMSLRGVARGIACAGALVALVTFGSASHSAARDFASRSVQISDIARAAVNAVDALPRVDGVCRIFFLGVERAPEWGGFVSMDSIVKALSERDDVRGCWIHADTPTYFQFQPAAATAADAAPWTSLEVGGKAVPWLRLGALTIAFVTAPPALDAQTIATTRFLRWQNGRFEDVSAEVAAGRVAVKP